MKRLRSQEGLALPIVLLFITVLIILGFAISMLAVFEQQSSIRLENKAKAYYIARAGVSALADYIINNQDNMTEQELSDFVDSIVAFGTSDVNSFGGGTFILEVTKNLADMTIDIVGIGTFNGVTASANFSMNIEEGASGGPIFDMAVFAVKEGAETITLSNSSKIEGHAGTNSIAVPSVSFVNSAKINGNLYIGPNGDLTQAIKPWKKIGSYVTGTPGLLPAKREYPLPSFPVFPSLPYRGNAIATNSSSLTISNDGFYTKLEASNSGDITIDVGTGIRTLVIDNFIVVNSGKIKIQGTGKLVLYVSSLTIGNSAQINCNTGDSTKLHMYYKGTKALDFVNSSSYFGSMYIEKADLTMANSNSIMGNIITGGSNVTVVNSANATVRALYAPNALVQFQNSASLTGVIIARTYMGSNSALITYAQITSPIPDLPVGVPGKPKFKAGRWR